MASILIGIQARTNSTRFPNKTQAQIGSDTVLDLVIRNCIKSAAYINKWKQNVKCNVSLLVPEGDPLFQAYRTSINVYQGAEKDLISRYQSAIRLSGPDYIVRITSDCPLLPPFVITKHVTIAINNRADYVTNSDPECRTSPDGHDVEVFSRKMFDYLDEKALTDWDREHVGTYAKEKPPKWANIIYTIGFVDQSNMKLSVDTMEDLERVSQEIESISAKERRARERGFGITRF